MSCRRIASSPPSCRSTACPRGLVEQQAISPHELPDVARDVIDNNFHLTQGVGGLEKLIASSRPGQAIKFGLPGGSDLALLMTQDRLPGHQVLRVYWAVSPAAIEDALDQIRTSLTLLVAELRAATPPGGPVPSEAADQAVNLIVTGKRNKVSVITTQASDGATAATATPADEDASGRRTTSRRIGAAVVGLATVVGAAAAVLTIPGH